MIKDDREIILDYFSKQVKRLTKELVKRMEITTSPEERRLLLNNYEIDMQELEDVRNIIFRNEII